MAAFRRFIAFWLLACVMQAGYSQNSASQVYSLSAYRKNLSEVIPAVEKMTGLSVAYSPSITDPSTKISCKISTHNLAEFLDAVFKKNGIEWQIIDNQIILRRQTEVTTVPRQKIIYGTVRDERNGELIAGARIAATGVSPAFSNSYGYFSVHVPEAAQSLEFFHPGYKPVLVPLSGKLSLPMTVALPPIFVEMQPVEIRDKKNTAGYWEMGQGGLLMNKINEGSGNNDMITALGTLPGFSLFGDGSTRFFVRGGESSQNLILIDESPVFNPSHLLGFVSSLDASVIREIRAWKGDAPAEYGNRLSGVIDIHTREGNLNRPSGMTYLSPFFSSAILELPLKKEKAGVMLSARRSNLEWLRLSDFTPYNFDFSFYDIHLKLHGWVNKKNRLYATLYNSSDQYSAVSGSVFKNYGLGWGNLVTSLRWNWLAGPKLFVNTFFNSSRYSYKLYLNSRHTDYWNSAVNWYALHSNLSWFASPEKIIRAGIGIENYISQPGNVNMGSGKPAAFGRKSFDFRSLCGYVYAGLESSWFNERLKLHPGLRLTIWGDYGPQIIPYFNSEYQVFATDTISSRYFYYTHTSLEPRLRMIYELSQTFRLMASAAFTRQYFQPLSNTVSPFTTLETWMPSGPNVSPQSSFLIASGIDYSSSNEKYECSLEAYYRSLNGQIDYRDHAALLYAPFPEGELRQGSAKAAGLELRLAKTQGTFTGWLTYTYSRVKKMTPGINEGKSYFPYFDRPHQTMILLQYSSGNQFNAGVAWFLSSGGMTTLPTGFYLDNGVPVPVYDARYNARLPIYHRLDVFSNYVWKGQKPQLTYELSLKVRNVYGRHNPFIYGFNKVLDDEGNFRVPADLSSAGATVPTRLSVNGVLPSLSLKISF